MATALLVGSASCMVDVEEEPEVASTSSPLFLEDPIWPDGKIPVCFSAQSQAVSDFATLALRTRLILNRSWPSVADVEFTGWGNCAGLVNGTVVINFWPDGGSGQSTGGGYFGPYALHSVDLGIRKDSGFYKGDVIPHEFGHIMGFGHDMDRSDFTDDPASAPLDCRGGTNQTGSFLGTAANDRESIMTSTGYCNTNINLSKWDVVGSKNLSAYGPREDRVVLVSGVVYAINRSNGDIYKHTGGTSWTRVGGPGAKFVGTGGYLYALAPKLDGIYRYSGSGTSWTRVGDSAGDIFACFGKLCATDFNDGTPWMFNGSTWSQIGIERAAMYVATNSNLYRLREDRSAVDRYISGMDWVRVGGSANQIFATANDVFASNNISGRLFRYTGGTSWQVIDSDNRTWVGVSQSLYRLNNDKSGVYKWNGTPNSWTKIGSSARWIYGETSASGRLHATNPTSHGVFQYSGTGSTWVNLGQP